MNETEKKPKGKAIPSYDPRKKAVVAALKLKSNCGKVTCVVQLPDGSFQGMCMWGKGSFHTAGLNTVTAEEVQP